MSQSMDAKFSLLSPCAVRALAHQQEEEAVAVAVDERSEKSRGSRHTFPFPFGDSMSA